MALWDIAGKAMGVPGLSAPRGQAPQRHPHQDDDRGLRPAPGPRAGRAVPGVGRALPQGQGRDRAGGRPRPGRVVREVAGPEIPITIDANCGWNVTTARIALEHLRRFDLRVAEQPIAPGDVDALAYLRTTCGIPIMADESVFTLADAWNVLRGHAADVISVYPGKNGGIAASVEIAQVAAAAGSPATSAATSSWASARPRCSTWPRPCPTSTAQPTPPTSSARITTKPTCWPSRWTSWPGGGSPMGPASGSHSMRSSSGGSGLIDAEVRQE